MWLTIVGIALAAFGVLFGVYESIWDRFTKHMAFKGKRVIFLFITLILFALSCAIGYESYRLINHGKDKDEPLKGYTIAGFDTQMLPAYAIYDSKIIKATTLAQTEDMHPDYDIVLSNANDLDIIINDIEIVIDEHINIVLDVYQTQIGAMSGGYNSVFYGQVHAHDKKAKLHYCGEVIPDFYDPEKDRQPNLYAKMEANSHDIITPYSPFEEPGLYTIHYVINYSLNGQHRQLKLPKETVYLANKDNPKYFIASYDWDDYFEWDIYDFNTIIEKGISLSKKSLQKLETISTWYDTYIPDPHDPLAYGWFEELD